MNFKIETPVSFMQPDWLRMESGKYANRLITLTQLTAAHDKAVEELIANQCDCGLEKITDGALRNIGNGTLDFWTDFGGMTSTTVLSGHIYQQHYSGDPSLCISGKLHYNPNHKIFEQYSFLHERVGSHQVVRLDIPAPAHFLFSALCEGWLENSPYVKAEQLAADIAETYCQTIQHLYELGCRHLLLCDRSWASLCDREPLKRLTQGGIDPVSVMRMLLEVNDAALDGLPSNLTVILYTPTKSAVNADCYDVVKTIFSHSHVTDFMIDVAGSKASEISMLADFPSKKGLILGIVNPRLPQLESPNEVIAMIERVVALANPARLALTTAGGFRSSNATIDSTAFTYTDQWRKLHFLQSL